MDVIVDDTPEAVTISSFDPVRREVAKRAMNRLVLDGRIHPARIEKLIETSQQEVEEVIKEEGERAAYDAGVSGLHREVIKMLGRLKFRTSYGQEQLAHAVETARLAGVLAAELGANVEIAKMGGLLHDIGKAMDHEIEGTHAKIGAEFCRRYGVPAAVVNCIESHHHEVEQECVEAIIVEAADAIRGAPGARRRPESYQACAHAGDRQLFRGREQELRPAGRPRVRIIVAGGHRRPGGDPLEQEHAKQRRRCSISQIKVTVIRGRAPSTTLAASAPSNTFQTEGCPGREALLYSHLASACIV